MLCSRAAVASSHGCPRLIDSPLNLGLPMNLLQGGTAHQAQKVQLHGCPRLVNSLLGQGLSIQPANVPLWVCFRAGEPTKAIG